MANEPVDYTAILAGLEAQRDALDAAITALRAVSGYGVLFGSASAAGGASTATTKPIDPSMIPGDAFFGLSIGEAAKKYLTLVKKKQTVREIAEALERGGLPHTSSNFVSTVATMMNRTAQELDLVRVGRGEWGLAGWYGNRRPKEPTKKQKRKKNARQNDAKPQPARAAAGEGPTVHQLAQDVLRAEGKPLPINEIIERIHKRSGRLVKKDTLGAVFSVAVRKGDTFVKTAPGVFGLK